MGDVDKQVEHLLGSKCPIEILSNQLEEIHVSAENKAELDDAVNMLEIHENEIRNLRQSINLRLRQYSMDHYKTLLSKRTMD